MLSLLFFLFYIFLCGANPCLVNNGGCSNLTSCIYTSTGSICGSCPLGYTGNGTNCVDIDECRNPVCDRRTSCTNTMGSYVCGPCPVGSLGNGYIGCSDYINPLNITGLAAWLDPINASCGSTFNWPDRLTRCIYTTKRIPACEATYKGRPTVRFVGTENARCAGTTAQIRTVIMAINPGVASGNGFIWGSWSQNKFLAAAYPSKGFFFGTQTARYANPGQTFGSFGSTVSYYPWQTNNWVVVTVEYEFSQPLSNVATFVGCDSSGGSIPGFVGSIAEILVYNRILTSTERSLLETYIQRRTDNPCLVNNGGCSPLSICTVNINSVLCGPCPSGYSGDGTTCTNIDECATDNGGCDNRTTCVDTLGSFRCTSCPLGFYGSGALGCTDINECLTNNGGCDSLKICNNTVGSFSCGPCPIGYREVSGACFDIDECVNPSICGIGSICNNSIGSFACTSCQVGFVGIRGPNCTDMNECAVNNGGCDPLSSCTNNIGSFTCSGCPTGFSGNGYSGCVDIDECTNNVCERCVNSVGSYYCVPYFVANSTQPISGFNTSNSVWLLSSVDGGQQIQITVNVGLGATFDSNLYYGTVTDPKRFRCSSTTTSVPQASAVNYTCTIAPGYGVGYQLLLEYCLTGNCTSFRDKQLFSYPAPIIIPNTLRRYNDRFNPNVTNSLVALNSFPEKICFNGSNFYAVEGIASVRFGPADQQDAFVCVIDEVLSTSTMMVCVTQSGAFGTNCTFTVDVDGQIAKGSDSYTYIEAIKINYVLGCTNSQLSNGTEKCPTKGGIELTIYGAGFLVPSAVFVGGKTCQVTSHVSIQEIRCLLPAGAGLNREILVTSDNQFSAPRPLVSYSPPIITSLSGCTSASPISLSDCSRSGGNVITIRGSDFGGGGALVLVGGLPCTRLQHSTINPYGEITCQLPTNTGGNHVVLLLQDGGEVSQSDVSPTVSYVACALGQYSEGIACMYCPSGKASSYVGTGVEACLDCSPGFFSNGSGVCQACSRGTFTSASGQSLCANCSLGSYSNVEAAAECIVCDSGYYSDSTPATACGTCQAGTFSVLDLVQLVGPTQCRDCSPGFFQPAKAQFTCSPCSVGRYSDESKATSCRVCAPGSFSGTQASNCSACPLGRFTAQPGAQSCISCLPGLYTDTLGATGCLRCPAGTYQPKVGMSYCAACANGSVALTPGAVTCDLCTPGSYTTSTTCIKCEKGTYGSSFGATTCAKCPQGTWAPTTGQTFCLDCPKGNFGTEEGAQECRFCPNGTFQGLFGATMCRDCPIGTYNPSFGQEQCIRCPVGTFANDTGLSQCVPCAGGLYNNFEGATECMDCPTGRYSDSLGTIRCDVCAPGTFNLQTGQTVCESCAAGFFQDTLAQTFCSVCKPGTYSPVGSPECTLCSPGFAQPLNGSSACMPCQPGQFQSTTGEIKCDLCEPGKTSTFAASTCTRCPLNTIAEVYGSPECRLCSDSHSYASEDNTMCVCKQGYYSKADQNHRVCYKCPLGAVCNKDGVTWETLETKAGWWRTTNDSTVFYQCVSISHCEGGRNFSCAPHREGPVCAVCAQGYQPDFSKKGCSVCASKRSAMTVSVIILVVVVFLYILLIQYVLRETKSRKKWQKAQKDFCGKSWQEGIEYAQVVGMSRIGRGNKKVDPNSIIMTPDLRNYPNPLYGIKIVLGFLQIVTSLQFFRAITWPKGFATFLQIFSFVNLDFIPWQSIGCVTLFDYADKLFAVTIGPLAIFFILVVAVLIPSLIRDKRDLDDTNTQRSIRKEGRKKVWKMVLITCFLIYPNVSSYITNYFVCRDVAGVSYLEADFSLHCYSPRWNKFLPLAIVMAVVYPIGIPCLLGYWIFRYHGRFHDPTIKSYLGFLYEAYLTECWWMEFADMIHKLFLTALLPFIPTYSQLPVGMATVAAYLMLILVYQPYVSPQNDRLHLFAQISLFAILLAGYLMVDLYSVAPIGAVTESLLSIILIAICVFIIIYALYIFGRVFKVAVKEHRQHKLLKKVQEDPEAIEALKAIEAKSAGQLEMRAAMDALHIENEGYGEPMHDEEELPNIITPAIRKASIESRRVSQIMVDPSRRVSQSQLGNQQRDSVMEGARRMSQPSSQIAPFLRHQAEDEVIL